MSATAIRRWAGIAAYGALFAVVLPLSLVEWARALEPIVRLRPVQSAAAGVVIAVAGLLLMLSAMIILWRRGGGLPMSPYPPPRRVGSGPYGWIANPIYAGFTMSSAGIAIATGSAAGLYVVTPTIALAAAAFVIGYEREATARRLGPPDRQTVLRLPGDTAEAPTWEDRLSIYALVLVPWLVAYGTIIYLGGPRAAISTRLAIDDLIPIVTWTEAIYASTYLFVALVPFVAGTRAQLRIFAIRGWLATVFVGALQLLLPFVMPPAAVPGSGIFSTMMRWERQVDASAGAMPAFHVVWALIAAEAYAAARPRLATVARLYGVLIAASCLTTGSHSIADVVAAFVAFRLVLRHRAVWDAMRRGTENIANSWREWTLGPVRLMNHGLWAGAAAFAGFLAIASLSGGASHWWTFIVALSGIAGAGAIAQILEGSSQLLRPFGYFGFVAGVLLATGALALVDPMGRVLLGAFAVAAPMIHIISRGRCLVQGCCHGRPAEPEIGIRFVHPRSRVVRLSALGGVPIHDTPLYSMLWNLVVGALLVRLLTLGAPAEFLSGIYLVLTGLGRFVEEHFRGEPQTKIVAGLRLYQWFSIAFVAGGAILSVAGATTMPEVQLPSWECFGAAACFATVATAAYGVDFPKAGFRFSRLV